ncbi:MAG: ABATE domain-containing protein [Acidobacteriota bacterium]
MPRKTTRPRGPQVKLAGALCVAYVNTANAHEKNRQVAVGSYDELLTWTVQAGALTPDTADALRRHARDQPQEAERIFARARELRSTLSRLFQAAAKRQRLPADDLARLNQELGGLLTPKQLTYGTQGLIYTWVGAHDALDRCLWPVLESAIQVLTSGQRLATCAAPECDLMFVDATPTRKRPWCDYRVCGRRVNALKHYHRRVKRSSASSFRMPQSTPLPSPE